jgi:hypothetical protein
MTMRALLLSLFVVLVATSVVSNAAAAGDPFTVSGIKVDATAGGQKPGRRSTGD